MTRLICTKEKIYEKLEEIEKLKTEVKISHFYYLEKCISAYEEKKEKIDLQNLAT